MQAGGGETDDDVACADIAARQQRATLGRADGKAAEIIVAVSVSPGISAVSPPISAQPDSRQACAMPATISAAASGSSLPVAK